MIIVASQNGFAAIPAGWEILEAGGSALNAVEACTRMVESDPDDHTVGYGGWPNLLGTVELDASIMDGTTRNVGAVAGLKAHRHAITVARAVMDRLPHVMVVGEGAQRLALELGMQPEELLTDEAEAMWRQGLEGKAEPGGVAELLLSRLAETLGEEPTGTAREIVLSRLVDLASDPEHVAGTVNFLAQDSQGRIASAVSTSGWAWKYPGRVGDSPIIGGGNYADDRWGAAACTGHGELAIRAATTSRVIADLARGDSLEEACDRAMHDLLGLGMRGDRIIMQLVAIDAAGNHHGVSTAPGVNYAVQDESMPAPQLLPRTHVDLTT